MIIFSCVVILLLIRLVHDHPGTLLAFGLFITDLMGLPSVPLVLLRFHVKYLIWSILTSNDSNNSKKMYAGFSIVSQKLTSSKIIVNG